MFSYVAQLIVNPDDKDTVIAVKYGEVTEYYYDETVYANVSPNI